jgi:pilus assembly protein CpaE
VISSNLAVSIAEGTDREAVLVDLDLQFGDAATALLLTPTYSITDAANAARSGLDAAALKVFLSRHSPSDLYVLCAPDEPSAGEEVPVEDINAVLRVLHDEFRHVVIDTDPGLSEVTLSALELATDIVIVADLDVPSVRGTRKLLEALDTIGMRSATRHIVLNRADSRVGLTPEEVEKAIGASIDVELPSTRQVPISLNEGDPIAARKGNQR